MGRLPSAESRIITLSPELINLLRDFTQDMTPDERQSRCATIPGQSQMANLNTKTLNPPITVTIFAVGVHAKKI